VQYHKKIITCLLVILSYGSLAYVQADGGLCRPASEIAPRPPQLPPLTGESIRLYANHAVVKEKLGLSILSGEVLVQRADQILKTPTVTYDQRQDTLNADNTFTLWDPHFIISGSQIKLHSNRQGEMKNVSYWLFNQRARGQANQLIRESQARISLEQASYTTCDPDKEIWRLDASQIDLDNNTAEGTARHVVIRWLNMPVFYLPYLWFPLNDDRKSGFLPPNLGSSDEAGTEISLPYYFNLAPNYDATLTPRIMSRRGLLLTTEFRYLTPSAGGQLELEYLPHDKAFGAQRRSLAFQHNGALAPNWLTDINFNYVSDQRYFEELGNNISVASITHLERRGDLAYLGQGWLGKARLQTFQTLEPNPAARPYERLPQLLFQTTLPEKNRHLNLNFQGEIVRFDRDTSVITSPIGNRFDIKSILNWPWRTPSGFIVPQVSLRYTFYDLDNTAPTANPTHQRWLATFSNDMGLFFERDVNWLGQQFLHTLEPRWFYRYTPYQDQSDIPIFDTDRYDLSFGQLFREDQFSGPDRVADGHQMTLGLTSRLLNNDTGIETVRASIGQIYYFRDRRVTLPDRPSETDSSSSIIMELATQFAKDLSAVSTFHWNPHQNNTEQTIFRLRYHPKLENIFNLSYRLRDNLLEQTDMSFHWSLGSRWNLLGRWNYSLPQEKTLETFMGVEYHSCCWAIRAITRRYLNNIDGSSYLNGFFLQLQLTGLGGIGKKADSFLEQRIPGYHDQW
jgi:LPS-assembly protein